MPPKRKRAEADTEATTTRPTRKSTRTTRAKNGTADETEQNGASNSGDLEDSKAPPSKKTRATTKKAPAAGSKTTGRGTRKASRIDDEPLNSTQNDNELELSKLASQATATVTAQAKVEYTPQGAQALFIRFADDDDPDVIGPGGVEKLCMEAGIALDGAEPLILAWQFKAQEMAKLTRAEWLQGTEALRIASLPVLAMALKELDDLVVHDKEPITPASSQSSLKKRDDPKEPYNRTRYRQYASNRKGAFAELYQFCFNLSKPPQSRNLDIETAMALWSVLLAPRHPIVTEFVEFLNENGSYKGANKDIWNMVHEFCRSINPDLSNYEADGAWPTMIDDFVSWKRSKMPRPTDTGTTPMEE